MATATQNATTVAPRSAPEVSIFTRVAAIPLIQNSLATIDDTLSKNTYTHTGYSTAKGISTTAIRYTEPLQVRLAPLIEKADGFANKAVDAVESRYPYPFKASPEEVATYVRERGETASTFVRETSGTATTYVRERRDSAVSVASETLDKRVKAPVITVAEGIDKSFSPVVDYFEGAVTRFSNNTNAEAGPSKQPEIKPETKYQYQRAIGLSKTFGDCVYLYSSDQVKLLRQQSVLLQRAIDTAQSISALGATQLATALDKVTALSENMLHELQRLQASIATIQQSIATSPAHLREQLAGLSASYPELTSAVQKLTEVVQRTDLSIQDRGKLVAKEFSERVGPVLESVKMSVGPVLERVGVRGVGKEDSPVVDEKENEFDAKDGGEEDEVESGSQESSEEDSDRL